MASDEIARGNILSTQRRIYVAHNNLDLSVQILHETRQADEKL